MEKDRLFWASMAVFELSPTVFGIVIEKCSSDLTAGLFPKGDGDQAFFVVPEKR